MELPKVSIVSMDCSLLCGACYFPVICGQKISCLLGLYSVMFRHVCPYQILFGIAYCVWLPSPIPIFLSSVKGFVGL